jgi:DNA-binding CsgD family transcriptional regulator
VQGFEMVLTPLSGQERALNVTILKIPSSRPDLFTLVHLLQPIDRTSRLNRALERLGAARPTPASGDAWPPAAAGSSTAPSSAPPLTDREKEVLGWVAAGLQNKEVAQKLGISLATVRNHIHNILEKLDVHSKLEAVSLAFRQGWVAGPNGNLGGPNEVAAAR